MFVTLIYNKKDMEEKSEVKSLATPEDISNLSEGLLKTYQIPLEKISESLKEVTNQQKTVIKGLEAQNHMLKDWQKNEEAQEMINVIASCRDKLVALKKQMMNIHERSNKLKSRSQQVLKTAKIHQTMRIQELEREQRLIGGQKTPDKP